MARFSKLLSVFSIRISIVLLAAIAIPLQILTYHVSCQDPLTHWTTPYPALQSLQAKAVRQGLQESHATYGMAVMINANSGQLISYYRSGLATRCADKWEPGSIMKPLTVAAALDTQSIRPDFTFYDSGSVTVGGQAIMNWTPFPKGEKNLEILLHDSLNVGAVNVVQHISDKRVWYDYLEHHYMLDAHGQGSVPLLDDPNSDYRYAVSSFGIGVVTTPLQMSLAYAALINGGVYHDVCLAKACTAVGSQVLKPSTSAQMQQLLTKIYPQDGAQAPPHYVVGGKSGTAPRAQLTDEYYLDEDSGTYVGFIEHGPQKYVALVRLDQPQGYAAASHAARDVWQRTLPALTAQLP